MVKKIPVRETDSAAEKEYNRQVPLVWGGEKEHPVLHANNLFVSYQDGVFLLSFGEAHGPYLIDPTVEEIDSIKEITVNILGRFALTPEKMVLFINVLQKNYKRYLEGKAHNDASGDATQE